MNYKKQIFYCSYCKFHSIESVRSCLHWTNLQAYAFIVYVYIQELYEFIAFIACAARIYASVHIPKSKLVYKVFEHWNKILKKKIHLFIIKLSLLQIVSFNLSWKKKGVWFLRTRLIHCSSKKHREWYTFWKYTNQCFNFIRFFERVLILFFLKNGGLKNFQQ